MRESGGVLFLVALAPVTFVLARDQILNPSRDLVLALPDGGVVGEAAGVGSGRLPLACL